MKMKWLVFAAVAVLLYTSCLTLPAPENKEDTLVLFPVESKVTGNWFMDGMFEFYITDEKENHVDSLYFGFTGMNNVHYLQGLEPGVYFVRKILFNFNNGNRVLIMDLTSPFIVEEGCVSSFAYTFNISIDIAGEIFCSLDNPFETEKPLSAPQITIIRNRQESFWEEWTLGNMGVVVDKKKFYIVHLNENMDDILIEDFEI